MERDLNQAHQVAQENRAIYEPCIPYLSAKYNIPLFNCSRHRKDFNAMRPLQPRESFKYSVTAAVVGSSEQAPTFRLLSRSWNIPCATQYCEPATAGQVSSSESEHCYFGTGGSDLLFIFATVPRESEHTLCHAVLRARNSWQVSSSESEHCYFGTGGSDLLFIFATVPRRNSDVLSIAARLHL
ncbi:hypothetical protein ANN_24094 [Periplaneta americana]|uniref:Uncharacterized protein n=1 Tax=Periplaneta americana TaxID=6978 RepID=A0ABQ8S2D1_PERAM|nr:hypothetical protein ANN_24094 [Periplaneta americana]